VVSAPAPTHPPSLPPVPASGLPPPPPLPPPPRERPPMPSKQGILIALYAGMHHTF
jgi:hypothetical protein